MIEFQGNSRYIHDTHYVEDINGNKIYTDDLVALKSIMQSMFWDTPSFATIKEAMGNGKEYFCEATGFFFGTLKEVTIPAVVYERKKCGFNFGYYRSMAHAYHSGCSVDRVWKDVDGSILKRENVIPSPEEQLANIELASY